MFFKNLYLYRLTRKIDLTQLDELLAEVKFTPCASQDVSKFGWVSPLGKHGTNFVHSANGQLLICAKKEEKILPTSVINYLLAEKFGAAEIAEGRALKKKEKEVLKEEIIVDLISRAFSRYQQTYAWINPAAGFIAVDASSHTRAEHLLALLRKSIGSLPVVPLAITTPPELTLTEWLKAETAPAGFTLEDEAELRSALEHGGIIRAKRQDLLSDEIANHLQADKLVTSIALNWSDTLSFVLKDDLSIKRIKFSDEIKSQNDDIDSEDGTARFDADFALMTGELSLFIKALVSALGGEE